MRKLHRRFERLVEHLHLVVLFQRRRDAAHHQDRLLLARLVDLHDLEAARERRILLDVLLVFGPGRGGDRAQRAARQRRLEQVGRVAGAGRAAGADQRVRLVDEQDDRLGRRLHLLDDLRRRFSNSPFMLAPACSSPTSSARSVTSLQRRRHVARGDPQREAFDDRRLADARLAGEDRIVLPAPHQDVDDLADLLVAADDRVDLAAAGLLGEIDGELLERLLLAHLRRRHRAAGLARRRLRAELRAVARGAALSSGEPAQILSKSSASSSGLILSNSLRDPGEQRSCSDGVLSIATTRWPVRTCVSPYLSVDQTQPRSTASCDVGGQIGDRRGAARQPIERLGQVAREPRRVDRECPHDAVQVGVLQLQDLVQPVHELDVGIAAQLAEDGGAFDRLVAKAVELAEQCNAADVTHEISPPFVPSLVYMVR